MRHNNYLILDEAFEEEFMKKGRRIMLILDFLAFARKDGSYKIVKNRFTYQTELPDEESFLGFFSQHIWKSNDAYLSAL
jgi:hypothetical protein